MCTASSRRRAASGCRCSCCRPSRRASARATSVTRRWRATRSWRRRSMSGSDAGACRRRRGSRSTAAATTGWRRRPRFVSSGRARAQAAVPATDGSYFDLVAKVIHHRYRDDPAGPLLAAFDMTTGELRADGRYDLRRYAPSLTGAFVEGSAGVGIGGYHYPAAATTEANTMLLARFAFGLYAGRRADRWGEARIFYDHRHDDFAGGLQDAGPRQRAARTLRPGRARLRHQPVGRARRGPGGRGLGRAGCPSCTVTAGCSCEKHGHRWRDGAAGADRVAGVGRRLHRRRRRPRAARRAHRPGQRVRHRRCAFTAASRTRSSLSSRRVRPVAASPGRQLRSRCRRRRPADRGHRGQRRSTMP